MPESPDRDPVPQPHDAAAAAADVVPDGPLRIFSERLGVDFDAVVERAKTWVAQNPLPADLGPEPFNVGQPRPPVDFVG
jgi:hypothetical protein